MPGSVTIERLDGVALLTLNNPPVNGLSFAMRAALGDCVMEALADESITAIVVAGAGRMFCGGADIREFGHPPPPGAASLPAVLDELEASRKPVVAAIHGVAAGGGLEVALACHVRIVAPGTRLGLPEVTLGIVPGAGGTQRLPRLIGVEAALDVIVGGKLLPAERALALGIADELAEGEVLDAAIARARQLASDGAPLRRASALDERVAEARAHPEVFDAFRKKMAKRARGFDAPYACVECVEAAVALPFAAGMARERQIFERLVISDQSAAQRHAFFAEREATKIPDVPRETQPLAIGQAAVIGCGTMGGGIAMTFANAGIPVTVVDVSEAALDKGLALVAKNYAATVAKGRLSQAEMDDRLACITGSVGYEDVRGADIVVEAVFERMDLKQEVFRQLDAVCKPDAVLATNTSTLDVDALAAVTARPAAVIGTHFFSPANVMRLMENVRGVRSSGRTIATVMQLAKRLGKVGVLVGVCDGFVGNRMLAPYLREAEFLLEEGALTPASRPGHLRIRAADGTVPDVGPRRQRRQLVHPPAAGGHPPPAPALFGGCGSHLRAGPLRAEDRRRLVPLRAGQPHAGARPDRRVGHCRSSGGGRYRPAHDRRRRDRAALPLSARQRGGEDPRRGDRPARRRHRRGLDARLRLPALPRRTDVLGRPGGPADHLRHDEPAA